MVAAGVGIAILIAIIIALAVTISKKTYNDAISTAMVS